ncbi:Atxe2 family lasso peptide isopeptidase [Asticcacaulis sp. BYS171W]|uniref:Atxe2 family lasso peptide isopeptidase n=1 Tax=Asticcacaulis aquaticus TaxID=2984212 RepID=A0ABT5HQ32_9CAUL|nr:Atxe2 family lasso peptide isopeptidase [Asticcacaulis aquaticus]MDC7682156.1 Atxe2 family lasso peptide isopeptidase [Asticcacaulis aquaticus]
MLVKRERRGGYRRPHDPTRALSGLRRVRVVALSALVAGFAALAYPACADLSVRDLVEVVDIANLALSPDGKWIVYRREQPRIDGNRFETAWYVAAVDGSSVRWLAAGGWPIRDSAGQSVDEPAKWSPDGRWIYFRAVVSGKVEVWRIELSTGQAQMFTEEGADVLSFALSAEGKAITVSFAASRAEIAQAEAQQYDDGVRLDPTVPVGQPLFRSALVNDRATTMRYNGRWMDRSPLLSERAPTIRTFSTEDRRQVLGEGGEPSDGKALGVQRLDGEIMGVSSIDGSRAAIIAETDQSKADSGRLTRLAVKTRDGQIFTCGAAACASGIEWLVWQPDGGAVVFAARDYGRSNAQSVFRWKPNTSNVTLLARSNGLLSGGRSPNAPCGVGNDRVICVEADPNVPPRLVSIQQGKQAVVLDDPNRGLQAAVRAEPRTWTDKSGTRFSGWYYPAAGQRKGAPLFVTYYTCRGFVRGGLGDEWPLAILAAQGIASLCINYPPDLSRDAVQRFDQASSAVAAAVDDLVQFDAIDRCRVGMGGLSFGSEVTLWTLTHTNLLAAASVASNAISPSYYWFRGFREQGFRDELKRSWGLGTPEDTPERWRAISPTFRLNKLRAPLLAQVVEQEYLETLDYIVPARLAGTPIDVYVFADEPHQKFQPRHKAAVYQRNLDWFRFWLQNLTDAVPEKKAQYDGWFKLKAEYQAGRPARPDGCPTT